MHVARTANISRADGRKQRRPLRKPAARTLKNSTEEMEERGGKRGSETERASLRPPWKNSDISCKETQQCTSKIQTLNKQGRVRELHETGGTLTAGEELSFGMSGLFSLIFARVERTLRRTGMKSGSFSHAAV